MENLNTQYYFLAGFAGRVLERGPNPRQGKKTDKAHPPIHPTKYTSSLAGPEKAVYELVVRHFLACLSDDARGMETVVDMVMAGEGVSPLTAASQGYHFRFWVFG